MARLHFFVETLLAHKYAASLLSLSCSVYVFLSRVINLSTQVLPSVNVFPLGVMFHLQLHYSHSSLHILLYVSLNHGVHSETMLANPDQIAEISAICTLTNFTEVSSLELHLLHRMFDSTLVKMPLCRKSHVTAQILSISFNSFHTG